MKQARRAPADRRTPLAVTLAHHIALDAARLTPDYIARIITQVTSTLTHGYPTTTIGAAPSTGPSNPDPLPATLTEAAWLTRIDHTAWLDELDRRLAHAAAALTAAIEYTLGAPGAHGITPTEYTSTRCARCDLPALANSAGIIGWPCTGGTTEQLCQHHHDLEYQCEAPECHNRCLRTSTGRPKAFHIDGNQLRLCTRHWRNITRHGTYEGPR